MQNKPVLYLLPGFMCDEAVWASQKEALAPYADVRIPVFRGYDSLAAMARSVLAGAPERFSVAGHSMGGRVAWELIHMAGNRIDKFAVLDTGDHPPEPDEPAKRGRLLELADRGGLSAVADEWIPLMIHPERWQDQELTGAIRAMILRNRGEDFKGQIKALLSRGDQSRYLPRVARKVLLICGEADAWSPLEQHRDMLKRLARAELAVVEGAGHMVTMERPESVNRILVKWLKQ